MPNPSLSQPTIGFGLSLALTSVLNALLTIAKEKNPAVLTGMQTLTGHHWITHAVMVLLAFVAFGWLFTQTKTGSTMTANRLITTIVAGVMAGGLLIVGFYLVAD